MAKIKLTMEDVSEFLKTLPYAQFKSLVEEYSAHTTNSFDHEMKRLVIDNLESRLEKLGVNAVCPKREPPIIVKDG